MPQQNDSKKQEIGIGIGIGIKIKIKINTFNFSINCCHSPRAKVTKPIVHLFEEILKS
jgi:hypothetical protein